MPTYPTPRYIHSGRSIHDPSIQLKDWWDGTYDEPVVFVYNDQTVAYRYRDSEGRLWEEWWRPDGTYNRNTSDSGDPYDTDAWRRAEPDEEPMGRSVIYQQPSRPLEETTPLFGPQEEPVLEPDYGLGAQPREGHWDPVSLRWVPDEPTSSVGKVLDDTPWDQPREGQPTTMRSAGILDDGNAGDTQIPGGGGGAGGSAEGEPPPVEQPPSATDPLAPDAPWTTDPWDQPREGQPTTMRSAGILGHDAHTGSRDESRPAANEESSDDGHTDTRGGRWPAADFDPSGPLDQASPDRLGSQIGQPTQEIPPQEPPPEEIPPEPIDEGDQPTQEEFIRVPPGGAFTEEPIPPSEFPPDDSVPPPEPIDEGEGSAARGFDPSGPLDQASPDRLGSQFGQPTQEPPPVPPPADPEVPPFARDSTLTDPAVPFDPDTTPTSVEGTASTRVDVDPSSPAAEGGGGGTAGMGVPYQDYIPFYPMVQDPATGEWRNAEPGEIPGVGEGEEGQPPATDEPVGPAPSPTSDFADGAIAGNGGTATADASGGIPIDGGTVTDASGIPISAEGGTAIADAGGGIPISAEGGTAIADAGGGAIGVGDTYAGLTLDPALFDASAPGPTLDPALFDASASGPTLDPALFDPNAAGPTIDPSLLDASAPGETIDPALLDPLSPGPTVDPVQLEQGIVQPSSFAEPLAGATDYGFTDPSLMEPPSPAPTTTPGQGFDDALAP
jgi:hypothetical protein